MDQIKQLKREIEQFDSQSSQSISLNSVISFEQIKEIETKWEISFPEEYIKFLTLIGDGGIINSKVYGCNTLQALSKYEEAGYSYQNIKTPFLLTRSWMPDWGDGFENADQLDEENLQQLKNERWEMINNHGHIVLIDDQTDNYMQWILIISGPCRGEVWRISEFGVQRLINCGFLRWLELFLSNKVEDYLMECKEVEYPPLNELDLNERCRAFLKKAKYIMNPPISISKVQEFEKRHNILLPVEYVNLITQIGDGSKKTPSYIQKVYSLWENDCLEYLDQPFLIQTEADYKRILLDERNYYKHFGPKNPIWNILFNEVFDENEEMDGPWLLPQYRLLHGCIPLMDKRGKSTGQCILILNGEYRGQVWGIDCWWIRPSDKAAGGPVNALTYFEAVGSSTI